MLNEWTNALPFPFNSRRHFKLCKWKLKVSFLPPDLILGKGTVASSGTQITNLETTLVFSHPASHKGLQVCPFYLNAHYFFIPPPLPHLASVSSFLPSIMSLDSWPVHFSPTHHLNWQVDLFTMHVWAFHTSAENCSLAPHCLWNKVQSSWWSPQIICGDRRDRK